jgi:glucokinase
MEYLLAGDIGGTKTALSLYLREAAGTFRELAFARYVSAEYSGLGPLVRDFLGSTLHKMQGASLAAAAFGIAGPIEQGVCKTTNLPWVVDQRALAQGLGAPVGLVNDFHAVALGIPELPAEELSVLQSGQRDPLGPCAILGAGTGLGEAIVLPSPVGVRVIASEGGHVDFAPRNALEVQLLQFLWRRYHRVSVERVISGPGLRAIYEFVVDAGLAPESPAVRAAFADGDPSKVIGDLGTAGTDPACRRALDMFVSMYGAEAGNLALKVLPHGGLYVAGGIAPKLIDKLRDGSFMHAFLDKGRLSSALERLYVAVVMNPQVGLIGARRLAGELSTSTAA